MTEQAHVRWDVQIFDASTIPPQGLVFFGCETSYLCYPSECSETFSDDLPVIIGLLRRHAGVPPTALYVPYTP